MILPHRQGQLSPNTMPVAGHPVRQLRGAG